MMIVLGHACEKRRHRRREKRRIIDHLAYGFESLPAAGGPGKQITVNGAPPQRNFQQASGLSFCGKGGRDKVGQDFIKRSGNGNLGNQRFSQTSSAGIRLKWEFPSALFPRRFLDRMNPALGA
jgi:hypothetical protein